MRELTGRALASLLLLSLGACVEGSPSTDAAAEYHAPAVNAFEADFAREPGVKPIRWGGWMKTLTPGNGATPGPDDKVTVHYRGTLTDGTEFDSSYKRGRPATFPLSGVIPCWTNAVTAMKTGEKARLVCPAASAYGERGSPPAVPGNATLVFEIELLSIVR